MRTELYLGALADLFYPQSRNLPPEKVREVSQEIGDVMVYLIKLSDQLPVDPIEAATEKVSTNIDKYPLDIVAQA